MEMTGNLKRLKISSENEGIFWKIIKTRSIEKQGSFWNEKNRKISKINHNTREFAKIPKIRLLPTFLRYFSAKF